MRERVRSATAPLLAAIVMCIPATGAVGPRQALESCAEHDGFRAYLVLVTDPGYVATKYELTEPGLFPVFDTVRHVTDNKAFSALVLYGGCESSPALGCQFDIELVVLAPDGTEYAKHHAPVVWTGIRYSDKRAFAMTNSLELKFNTADPRGVYRVVAKIRDVKRDITLKLATTVELEEAQRPRAARPN